MIEDGKLGEESLELFDLGFGAFTAKADQDLHDDRKSAIVY